MGLKDTFQNAARTALRAAGDVPKDIRYLAKASTVYNTSTGVTSIIGRSYFFSMLFETYQQREIDNAHILPTDVRAVFAQKDVPELVPELSDSIHILEVYGSTEYELKDVKADSADATWVLQLRARGKGSV